MKNLIILGSCGSIGLQTVDIVVQYPRSFKAIAISVGSDNDKAIEVIRALKPGVVCCRSVSQETVIKNAFPKARTCSGAAGLLELLDTEASNILVVNALVGSVGLMPTIRAIEKGFNIALANKETLVMAGEIIMPLAQKQKVKIIPIDSEHSAIMQVLRGEECNRIKNIYITASGGAFRDKSRDELINVTKEEALNHPNWKMGAKITIDSATMMNKGFEVIEAVHLFSLPPHQVKTLLHRQSIVHSIVEYEDHSMKAQLGTPDMRVPIMYALSYPKRLHAVSEQLDLIGSNLTFEELSLKRYPCLQLAYEAINKGNIFPTVLQAANEAAVKLFLNNKIKFLDIEEIIAIYLAKAQAVDLSIEEIIRVDQAVQQEIIKCYGGIDL